MNNQRPKNLNLLTIRQPIPAIVSILHRISGVVLFIFIPFLLWSLSYSLSSPDNFETLRDTLASPVSKFITWVCLAAYLFHFVAGIRHLLMDVDIGVELKSGRAGAWLVMIIAVVLMVLAGVYLW